MKLTRILKEGMAGSDVKHLHKRLVELKYANFKPTGNFGQLTVKSVIMFQRQNGLDDDGVVGNKTWYKLFNNDVSISENIPTKNIKSTHKKFKYNPSFVTSTGLEIYDEILPNDEYIKKVTKKKTIYLHHTAGGSRPDWTIKSWDRDGGGKPYRIATSYIIGRRSSSTGDQSFDGKVFMSFDDKYWAYHLGVGGSSSNSSSIGIEICNYGYCRVVDGKFINYVNREIPANEVVDLGEEFRGFRYWEKYTYNQIENLKKLLLYLMDKHDIKKDDIVVDWNWFDYNPNLLKGSGIRTHTQVRKDKTDCFPQIDLINMLNSI